MNFKVEKAVLDSGVKIVFAVIEGIERGSAADGRKYQCPAQDVLFHSCAPANSDAQRDTTPSMSLPLAG